MMIPIELYPDEYLRVLRGRLEMTQGALARRLGVARQRVNLYENGLCEIPKDRLEAVKRMAEEVEELATAIVDTSARITSDGRRHMSFKIMSDEFDSLATLIRCRALAAKIANELRNKRPAHFVDKLSLADIHASLERAVGVLEQKTSTVGRERTAPVVKELQQARNR
jgi:transcriptional regulator with XRE-family HTH domain